MNKTSPAVMKMLKIHWSSHGRDGLIGCDFCQHNMPKGWEI
jgi:hypothetical protein